MVETVLVYHSMSHDPEEMLPAKSYGVAHGISAIEGSLEVVEALFYYN